MRVDLETLEALPSFVSSRKGTLKSNGGPLVNMYDGRFDSPYRRSKALSGHNAHKDHRDQTRHKDARRQIRVLMGKD